MNDHNPLSQFSILTDKEGAIAIDVKIEDETVWLTLNQLADLFERDKSVISKHLKTIFDSQELKPEATVANFATVQIEGKRKIKRQIDYYNLDMILSIGYRVNSKRGTQFRQWATNVLKPYIVKGYALNQKRLFETKLTELEKALSLLSRTIQIPISPDITQQAIQIIQSYAASWKLLLDYDEKKLALPQMGTEPITPLPYLTALQAIDSLKENLKKANQSSKFFGQERDDALKAILGNIEQTFSGEALYRTVEEKAAHLLYFIIKDHPFNDGNKRIGCLLFLLYLNSNKLSLHKINDSTLVALALMVAESDPQEKQLIITLILNLI